MTNSKFLYHAPCENCGSRDNLGVYEDHSYCFGCHSTKIKWRSCLNTKQEKIIKDMIEGIVEALPSRKIDRNL